MVYLMARPTKLPGSRFPYARKVVPKELRGVVGRTEFKRPLRGANQAENRRLHAEALIEWEGELAVARAKVQGNLVSLSGRQVDAFCGGWYREQVELYGENPGAPLDWELYIDPLRDEVQHEIDEEIPEYEPDRQALAEADALLSDAGIAADTPSILATAKRLWDIKLRFGATMGRRAGGDWSPDLNLARFPSPALPSVDATLHAVAPPEPSMPFERLVTAWAAERRPPKKTREKWDATFAGFVTIVGHNDARKVTVADVRAWKERRLADGKSLKTVADGISVMRATFNWGIRNGLLPRDNPFAGMAPKIDKRGRSARDGFTDEQASAILLAERGEVGWRRWLPWLLAFTGCRIEEIAEARKRDIRKEAGTWILDVVPTDSRLGKNPDIQRMVPLHPALLSEDLLGYVNALPDGPLFPDLAVGRYGSRGSIASKAHSRWLRDVVGLTDLRLAPAHSWRHRMEDQLRIARVPAEAQDAITGHSNPRNAGAGYGRGYRGMPDETLKELAKIPSPIPSS